MNVARVTSRVSEVLPLLAIVGIGAVLRLYALPQRGLIYWDEGKFALEGVRFWAIFRHLAGAHIALNAGKTVGTAKPGHALLLGLGYLILGNHAFAALAVNAVAGILSIGALFLIARRITSPVIALLAALFLAVSQYDAIYARSVLSESDANVIFLCAVLCYIAGYQRGALGPMVAAAVLGGAAFTVNYRLVVYLGVLVLFDLVMTIRTDGWAAAARHVGLWAAGGALIPLAWQGVDILTRLNGLVLFRSEFTGRPMWYLQEAYYQIHQGKQAHLRFEPVLYFDWYLVRDGWWRLLLLIAGLATAIWRRGPLLLAAGLVVIPYVIYVFAPFVVPRNLEAAIPFISLLQACAVGEALNLVTWRAARIAAAAGAALAVAVGGWLTAWHLTDVRSGYADASAYVAARHRDTLSDSEIVRFYLRGTGGACRAYHIPRRFSELALDRRAGLDLIVMLRYPRGFGHVVDQHSRLLGRYRLLGAGYRGEDLVHSEQGLAPWLDNPVVEVETIAPMRLPAPAGGPPVCRLNILL
ncbi:MAG TPA: glycosyltransferase family 39 protein [Chloroflexota bacterium]|nr:glycosyltransferase family 39 protein [Chloroflexota bacterium]